MKITGNQDEPPRSAECEHSDVRIGPYQLFEQLGEGGFGTVWRAVQTTPIRRQVALKIIKLGMDTRNVIARFEQERQALALMDHPHIARVLDAGSSPEGRPYFVMELVRGKNITEYCNENNLAPKERIELFLHVCQAVQHAHQKGIIHRDLKPSNILVTDEGGRPFPKIIDFGVAKATRQEALTEHTLFTRFQQTIGTPLYMSPEQAEMSGLDVDTRSDIYSLGVLLCELLAGRTPHDPDTFRKVGLDEMRRLISEQESPKPSTLFSTMPEADRIAIARSRSSEPTRLLRILRGDLDWIILKALENDRGRRYASAGAFAQDLQRHLAQEAVLARPPSILYRFERLGRRHQAVIASAAMIALSLFAGAGISVSQALRARHEAHNATAALAELQASGPALVDQARGLVAMGKVDQAIEKLEFATRLQPTIAENHLYLAELLRSQSRFQQAAQAYGEAARLDSALSHASSNSEMCEGLAQELFHDAELSRDSIVALYNVMRQEDRPAAEMKRVQGRMDEITHEAFLSMSGGNEALFRQEADGRWSGFFENHPVDDLSPLRGLPICELLLHNTNVSDLSPLRGMPIEHLLVTHTKVTSIEPLRGLRLKRLWLGGCPPEMDLSPLAGMDSLENLLLPEGAKDLAVIRDLPNLKRLSYHFDRTIWGVAQTPAHFWSLPLIREGRLDQAEKILRQEIALLPTEAPRAGLGALMAARGAGASYYEECLALIKQGGLPTTDGRVPPDWVPPSILLLNPKEAVTGELIDSLLNRTLVNSDYWFVRGLCEYRKANFVGALKALSYVHDPSSPATEAAADAVTAMVHHNAGMMERAKEALARAAATIEPAWPHGDIKTWAWHDWLTADLLLQEARQVLAEPVPAAAEVLIPPTSEWRWLHPLDGVDPAETVPEFHTTFFTSEFDDSTWNAGLDSPDETGGFGYGDDWFTGIDIGAPEVEHRKSAYFRCRFTTGRKHNRLFLRCYHDDGIIVYLNGSEVARRNVVAGTDSYQLTGSATIDNELEKLSIALAIPGDLPAGEHVLAISLHNASPTSSDLRIGAITLTGLPSG